uniref:Uncharacterized protein n=1 Tax=viral metagenome TaxID=1070528 RepID=A0A6M3L7H7_9ZZZZ
MSTSFYRLRPPITSVRPEVLGGHTHVGIWVNHAKSGSLVVRNEEWDQLLDSLTSKECVIHTSYGGTGVGVNVNDLCPENAGDVQVVSEYRQLFTVGEVRNMRGVKR